MHAFLTRSNRIEKSLGIRFICLSACLRVVCLFCPCFNSCKNILGLHTSDTFIESYCDMFGIDNEVQNTNTSFTGTLEITLLHYRL